MRLMIHSHWPTEAEPDGRTWEGEIPDGPTIEGVDAPYDVDAHAKLEYVFRFFNRVDDGDHERMAAVGYYLPSLSMDDVVTLDGERWRCAALGWEKAE